MIRLREGDDKFTCTLVTCGHADPSIDKALWIHQCYKLKKEIWLCFEQIRRLALDRGFEFICIFSWDAVPSLCLPPMFYMNMVNHATFEMKQDAVPTEVDAVRIMILREPLRLRPS